ncbi:DELTA-sagatoxin-Srs1a-like [Erpetoichthys calabaricus]|uniref:DELTA-sagatoxin-Srs1a-like n=1 Tax=Erpetoichthys calabaricus TaxID=27687 RepID=UPI0010A00E20|nr:DELTA-sagatoxin-Srs1a-like [Erpetoichthys calabaricus]
MNLTCGASLQGTSAEKISKSIKTTRNVVIEISNNTTKFLTNPKYHCHSGYNNTPLQPTIEPRSREACSFSKKRRMACGSVGVMTYDICASPIQSGDMKLAIMFSVPYDYNWFENWFAVGFYDLSKGCDHDLYDEMYYQVKPEFKRAKATQCTLSHSTNGLDIKVAMSNACESIMQVELWESNVNYS